MLFFQFILLFQIKMPKNIFLQIVSILSIVIVVVTVFLNKVISKSFLPHTIVIDFNLLLMAIGFSSFLMLFVYLAIKYDKLIIPEIITKLDRMKSLLFELTTIEIVYISFLAGISEELLFRGFLQSVFGLVVASLLFGAVHFLTFGYFILATGIGFYLGGIYLYSGNILVPIAVHTMYDVFVFKLLTRLYLKEDKAPKAHMAS